MLLRGQSQNNLSGKGKRPLPGHSYRLAKEKKLKKSDESIPKSVYLLDEPDSNEDEEYSMVDSMIILKGECDLYCNAWLKHKDQHLM